MPIRSSQMRISAKAPKSTRYHLKPTYVQRAGFGHFAARASRRASQAKAGQCISLFVLLIVLFGDGFAQAQTGTLLPNVPGAFTDNNGNPCASCRVYTYASGTSTPLSTFSNAALSVANANPTILDSAGRGTFYLSAASYKIILKSAADATIWERDPVAAVPNTTIASAFNSTCDGRLTLTTVTPVTTADVTAATTIYFSPYRGNRCALYDGSAWNIASFTERSLALGSDAADTNYDVFLFLSSGTPTLERVAWSTGTARATALALQDGVAVKSSDTTRRYVGTYRTTTTIGQTEDSVLKRFVWNNYHRVPRPFRVADATDTWTYTLATIRQARASTANQVAVVVGLVEHALQLSVTAYASNSSLVNVAVGIGEDSTTVIHASCVGLFGQGQVVDRIVGLQAQCDLFPASVGYHVYAWLEASDASGTTTWRGDAGLTTMRAGVRGVAWQ